MDCKEADFLLYSCEKLSAVGDKHPQLAEHIKECEMCRQKYEEVERLQELFSLKKEEHPPKEYWAAFSDMLRENLKNKLSGIRPSVIQIKSNIRLLRLVAAVLAGVLVGGGAFWIVTHNKSSLEQDINNDYSVAEKKMNLVRLDDCARNLVESDKRKTSYANAIKKHENVFKHLQDDLSGEVVWLASEGANTELGLNNRLVRGRKVSVMVEIHEFSSGIKKRLVFAPLLTVIERQQVDVSFPINEIAGARLRFICRPTILTGQTIRLDFEMHLLEQPSKLNFFEPRVFGLFSSLQTTTEKSIRVGQFTRDGKNFSVDICVYQTDQSNSKTGRSDI